jgi:hypothetical protein
MASGSGHASCMTTPCIDWTGASWWWPQGVVSEPLHNADFACDLDLDADPDHAWIALTCGSWYTFWVDGVWTAHGPPREVTPWQYYDVIDLRPLLHTGRNRLRLRVWHIGLPTQYHAPCQAGILLRGLIDDLRLDDPGLWRSAQAIAYLPDAPHLHHCAGYGEHVDLAVDPSAWLHADADATWLPSAVIAAHPLPGRERLLPSDLPDFTGRTRCASLLHVREGWQVWDFGQEVFGFLSADLDTTAAATCDLLQGESLQPDGLPDHRFGGGDFRDRLELPVGRRAWESFEKRAMRYLALPEGISVHRLALREHHRPLTEVWRSRADLMPRDRAIVAAAARTVTLCCDDLLNDCPRRERAQYNDPAVYMAAFPLLFGTHEPIRRWLRQYLRGAGPDGVLRSCYPSSPGMTVIPDFSIAFAQNLRAYLDATGDVETARLGFPAAVAGVTAFERFADRDGLLCEVPGWIFLCNSCEVAKYPRSAGLNALYAASFGHLAVLAERLGDVRATGWRDRANRLRTAWRAVFWRDGRILDADSSPQHEQHRWWNYHVDADRGRFAIADEAPQHLTVPWQGAASRLTVAAAGRIRISLDGHLLLDAEPRDPWTRPHPFESWEVMLPADFHGGMLEIELSHSRVDWECYLAADGGAPGPVQVEGRRTACRPWSAPRWNQITAGYAIDGGMLDPAEARAVLRRCLRSAYHVPWLKRTTPIVCTPTTDRALIADRAVLCNTPQSLAFFCRALRAHGMADAARDLCRLVYGAMLDAGATTLWEEFAPRSSLCHAWGAMCVEHLLGHR